MNEEHTLDLNEWAFPEMDLGVGVGEIDLSAYFAPEDLNNKDESEEDARAIEEAPIQEHQAKSAVIEHDVNLQARLEIEQLKQNYESKLQLLNNLVSKLKNPASIIDEELLELIQDIIKKISKRIILKEIATDPAIFSHMITDLKSLIDSKNGMITIFLSAQDYHRLDSDKHHASGLANIDNQLNEGDVVIKSNFAEVRALLDERIEQLIRIQHD